MLHQLDITQCDATRSAPQPTSQFTRTDFLKLFDFLLLRSIIWTGRPFHLWLWHSSRVRATVDHGLLLSDSGVFLGHSSSIRSKIEDRIKICTILFLIFDILTAPQNVLGRISLPGIDPRPGAGCSQMMSTPLWSKASRKDAHNI